MTLSDAAYQELRDAAIRGHPRSGSRLRRVEHPVRANRERVAELRVIEMNPPACRGRQRSRRRRRATRSPRSRAKLAVGYTLDEIPNDLTGTTPASFEPTLDYVVVKFRASPSRSSPGPTRRSARR